MMGVRNEQRHLSAHRCQCAREKPPPAYTATLNVFPLRTFIKTGDLVRVTGGLSAGKLCVVVRMRHDRLWIESLQGGIVCKDGDLRAVAWIERHRLCRVPDQALPQRYALPAWPARWEASLHERAEVEA